MVTIVGGLVGGLVATIVMTVFMMTLGDDSPPTAVFWSKYLGNGTPDDYMMPGIVLHLIYGTIAGAVFAAVIPLLGFASVATIGSALLWGLVYGVLLFIGFAVFWMKLVLGMSPEMKAAGMALVFHLVYGVVLGGWVGYGILG